MADQNHCPTCNAEEFTCFQDKRLRQSLYDYEVYCIRKENGCDWSGELGQLEKHLNLYPQPDAELEGCLFTSIVCRFELVGCDVKLARGDMPKHLREHSEIHLELIQKSESSLNAAFIGSERQTSKLAQQVLGVNKMLSLIKEKHEREISQLNNEREQLKQQLVDVNETLSRRTEEYEQLQKQIHTPSFPPLSQLSFSQTSDPVLGIGTPTPPVTFTMTNFDILKRTNGYWYSPPFYTHHHGYRMCLRIHPNGHRDSEFHGTQISVYVFMKRGEFDNNLKWPFRGVLEIRLLDQEDSDNYYSNTIDFDENTPGDIGDRVTEGNRARGGKGCSGFISHTELRKTTYLKYNCLLLQIYSVEID